jgi:hypothetical protein
MEAGDFPDELQRSGAHLFRCDRRIEIEKRFDVAAHVQSSGFSYPWVSILPNGEGDLKPIESSKFTPGLKSQPPKSKCYAFPGHNTKIGECGELDVKYFVS